MTFSIVQLHCTNRTCKHGQGKFPAKQFQGSIHRLILADSVHIQANLLPFVIVSDGSVASAFCTGSRHFIAACSTVTYRACLTDFANLASCIFDYFLKCHFSSSSFVYFPPFGKLCFYAHFPQKNIHINISTDM